MRVRNRFRRRTGRHVPRPAPVPVPRLAIEAPGREQPTGRERLADGVSALTRATASGMAWLIGYGALEEVPDEPAGMCDWGDCGEIASEMRWAGEYGWLPVCAGHAEPEDVPRPEPVGFPGSAHEPGTRDLSAGPGHLLRQIFGEPDEDVPSREIDRLLSDEARKTYEEMGRPHDAPERQVIQTARVGGTYLPPTDTWQPRRCPCIIGSDEGRAGTGVQDRPVHGTLPPPRDRDPPGQ